jgi:hypothetical protein
MKKRKFMMKKRVEKWTEEEQREYLDLIRRRDLIRESSNVLHCPKVFLLNAIFKKFFQKAKVERITKEDWAKNLKIIDNYIKGAIDIRWLDGDLVVYDYK